MAETTLSVITRPAMAWEAFLAAGEGWQRRDPVDGEVESMPLKRTAEVVDPDRAAYDFDERHPLTLDGVEGFALDLKSLFEV